MGMHIDEYSDRLNQIGKGMNRLCDDLYAATEEKIPLTDVDELLAAGKIKIELFDKLSADTTGGMHDQLHYQYGDNIDEIKNYSEQLREKYYR